MNIGNEQPFITNEETTQLAALMGRKYASFMGDRHFEAGISKDARGVYAKVILRNEDGSFYYPVEGRMLHDDHDMSHRDGGLMLLDYIDAYFEEYLKEGGDVYLPIDWADYDADGVALQLRGQILNLVVEKMADDLLRRADTTSL